MKGIDLTADNIAKSLTGDKWQTRRLKNTYRVGEIVFVREPFYLNKCYDHLIAKEVIEQGLYFILSFTPDNNTGRKRNKRYMPSVFARTIIEITDVKQEPLCSISYVDCIAEGVKDKEEYRALFDSLHGAGSFDLNPIIYAYTYKVL